MNWKLLFNQTILSRGRQYFRNGRVLDLEQSGGSYTAQVIGSVPYDVKIQVIADKKAKMTCVCPYAQEGKKCKHMAAVWFAIEDSFKEDSKTKNQNNEKVYPFKKLEDDKQYRYFDMEQMTDNITIFRDSYEKAKKAVESKEALLQKVDIGFENELGNPIKIGIAYGEMCVKKSKYPVEIVFHPERIMQVKCSVPGCCYHFYGGENRQSWQYRGFYAKPESAAVCVHGTALLLLLGDFLKKNNPGDFTDLQATMFLESYRDLKNSKKVTLKDKDIILEPKLEKDFSGLRVGFRIGTDKLYVVKNLTELVKLVEMKDVMQLGKTGELDFSECSFDEKSKLYYEYISAIVFQEMQRRQNSIDKGRYFDDTSEEIKGKIDLYGSRLDDFFELAENDRIAFANKDLQRNSKESILLVTENLYTEVELKKKIDKKGVFQGIGVSGSFPELIHGVKHKYYLADGKMVRIPQENSRQLQPLAKLSEYGAGISFTVGRKNLSEFYYRVLPVLKEYVKVKDESLKDIQEYLPPEAGFVFFLDAEQGNVTCKASAVYGNQECNLMDWLIGDIQKEDFRDIQSETEVLTEITRFFPEKDWEQKMFHCGADADVIYEFLLSGVSELMKIGEVQSTEAFTNLKIRKKTKLSIGVSVQSEIMNLEIFSEDLTPEELLEVLTGYRKKKKYHRLKSGEFLNLEDESLEELSKMLETMQITPKAFVKGKIQIPLYRALYLDKMLEKSSGIYAKRDQHFKKLVKDFKTVNESDFEIPESLGSVMRNYQIYGHKWLRTLESCGFGGILADDMGLGKTLQVISVLLAASEARKLEKEKENESLVSLVVTPASLVYNWKEEFSRFAPTLKVVAVTGTQEERIEIVKDYEQWDVLITSYDLLKRDIAEYEGKHFSYEILDEAQYIKNHTTIAAKSVKVIQSKVRFALTGTPIENRLSELWSIFDYLMPGFLYGYDVFRKELEIPVAKYKDEEATQRLKRMVSPFILRRLKKEVLSDLPEKIEEVRYARMEAEQQRLYDGQVVHMQKMLREQSEENFQKNKLQILAELTKIRQICCDPSLFLENYKGESAKREACVDLIKSAIEGEHKILLFSQFTSMLELLEADLQQNQIPYYKITGATSKEKRIEMVRQFNEGDIPVFLISLKAGGTGLNLTGADIVIHYDPWWNLAVQNQATDRAHRIGQTKVVSVYQLIIKDSIEEKILHMQESKKNLADEILNGETGSIVNMTKDELLELIGS